MSTIRISKKRLNQFIREAIECEASKMKECDDENRDLLFDDELNEEAPPGQKYENQILAMKKQGVPANIAYATAWKRYNKEHGKKPKKESVVRKQVSSNRVNFAYRKFFVAMNEAIDLMEESPNKENAHVLELMLKMRDKLPPTLS